MNEVAVAEPAEIVDLTLLIERRMTRSDLAKLDTSGDGPFDDTTITYEEWCRQSAYTPKRRKYRK